jgi:cyclophilin family peptidyl-prolyl cis-trans isomerase/Skp family chaperone for outer membrane proteins
MRISLAILGILTAATALRAADAPAPADKMPVAIVNLQRVTFECPAGKAVITEIQDYIKKKQDEIKVKQEAAAKLQTELTDKEKTLTPEQKAELTKKIETFEKEVASIRGEAQREITRIERNAIGQLQKEADRQVREYAKEKGVQLLYDTSGEEGPGKFILINPAVDITEEVTKRMASFKVKPVEEEKPDPNAAKTDPKPQVLLETSLGEIVVELDREKAPITVANFLNYVESKHYDGTIFHRVIKDFMIQGGGFTEKMTEKPTRAAIRNEARNGLSNMRGTIAMARTSDIDSATAQFFINTVDNQKLDHQNEERFGYAVFGKVIKGMDVVDKIREVKTGEKDGHQDVPVEAVLLKSARRVNKPMEK